MGFLDDIGLAHFWGKVTARRKVLTAAEYAALSDEEKNADVVYMVPEEGGEGGGVPSGCIMLWHGPEDTIPDGWHICDGTEGTLDLRGVFALGAGGAYAVGDRGGKESVGMSTAMIASHTHNLGVEAKPVFQTSGAYVRVNTVTTGGTEVPTFQWEEGRKLKTNTNSGGMASTNHIPTMPPYCALYYIMKL